MDLVKAGIGISKTFRNVGRLQEIVMVFARHGFDEFVQQKNNKDLGNIDISSGTTPLSEELKNKSEKDWNQILGYRLRKCFEELGPTFIKFGQLLSTREDIFHPSFIEEVKMLRDKVKPIVFDEVKETIEQSLNKKIHEVFSEVEKNPIGTASIGVVYRAKLLDGSPVVIKVRRPGIEKDIATDFSILLFLTKKAESVSDELKYLGISRVLNDFSATLHRELNFNVEALNAERFKKNLAVHDEKKKFYVPRVYTDYTRENIIVMEELTGIPFSDSQRIKENLSSIVPDMEYGVKLFMKTFLKDGFFHADLHGGNFFYLINKQIGLIDFGLMGSLSRPGRHHFIAIIYALVTYNYENLVYEFLDVAEYDVIPDTDALIRDIKAALSPFVGLSVQQTNFADLLSATTKTLKNHQLFLPTEWFVIFRALITLDGVGKQLGIDLNIFGILESQIDEIIETSFSKDEMIEEVAWAARDLSSSLRIMPRHLKWFLKDFAKKGYAIEVKNTGYETQVAAVIGALIFLGFALIACVMVIGGLMLVDTNHLTGLKDIGYISWGFWILGLIFFSLGMMRLKKSS